MTRTTALLGSAFFLVLAPGTVAGLVPWLIVRWPAPIAGPTLAIPGAVVIGFGLALLLECFGRFAVQGRGTPAPVAPPARLVVTGPYRRVRNPMYVAVIALILGQAALFANPWLLAYAALIWLCFHTFVLAYEEPTLKRLFPQDYPAFFAAVPRWIPRLTPWRG